MPSGQRQDSFGEAKLSKKSRLRKRLDPRKWQLTKARGNVPPTAFLWFWTGRLRRWRRHYFDCSNPGILIYHKSGHQTGSTWSKTINLHGASVSLSRSHSRQFSLTSGSMRYFIRTIHKQDRDAWVQHIQGSIAKYDVMLQKASMIMLTSPPDLQAPETGEEQLIHAELDHRLQTKLQNLEPYKGAFEQQLSSLQQRMINMVASFDLDSSTPPPPWPAVTPTHTAEAGTQLASAAPATDSSNGIHAADEPCSSHPAADAPLDTAGAPASSSAVPPPPSQHSWPWSVGGGSPTSSTARRAETIDSFISAESHRGEQRFNPSQMRLSAVWAAYTDAVKESVGEEVQQVLELGAENAALKRSIHLYKQRLRRMGLLMRNLSKMQAAHSDAALRQALLEAGIGPTDFEDCAEDLEELLQPDPSLNLDDVYPMSSPSKPPSQRRLQPQPPSGLDDEFFEALEVVHTHEYLLKNSAKDLSSSGDLDGPPEGEEADTEQEEEHDDADTLDDNGSDSPDHSSTEGLDVTTLDLYNTRSRLPLCRPLRRGFSIWSILKNAIGRDLTRITMPATINEPLSALQRITEELEYRALVGRALQCPASIDRLLHVAVFALSSYSSAVLRDCKPFNPLLGETFEWQCIADGTRFVCEQVSHHPPISCWCAVGENGAYEFSGEMEMRSKFWGKSVEMLTSGQCWLKCLATGDVFSWNKATAGINNIIMGKLWIDWYGDITVRNHTTGEVAHLQLHPCKGKLAERGAVSGSVQAVDGSAVYAISGNYMRSIAAQLTPQAAASRGLPDAAPQVLYQCNPLPEDAEEQYNLTALALTLNDAVEALLEQVPPTDSRLRTDQRALEQGAWDKATAEKLRLEEKQRQAAKERKAKGELYEAKWFRRANAKDGPLVVNMGTPGGPAWQFGGDYWAARAKQDWARCPDIYSDP